MSKWALNEQFVEDFLSYASRYSRGSCYPGLLYYKSEKFTPKIKLGGTIFAQQVLIAKHIKHKYQVDDVNQLRLTCGHKWCCNPRHIEVRS